MEKIKTASTSKEGIYQWLEIILYERFGINFKITAQPEALKLSIKDHDSFIMLPKIGDVFLLTTELACSYWKVPKKLGVLLNGDILPAPGITKLPSILIEKNKNTSIIHYDIFGLVFWMLSRQEELGKNHNLDTHERFSSSSSHAFIHNYLERPIVDEWLIVLGEVIKEQWSFLIFKRHEFKIKPSHDVDVPSLYGFCNFKKLIYIIAKDVLKKREIKSIWIGPWIWLNTKTIIQPLDPYNTFDWIMDIAEKNGITSAFYFICGNTNNNYDAEYSIKHPAIRNLMKKIYKRRHEIGLHPSYNTFKNTQSLSLEANTLKKVCEEEEIKQKKWGGRMHFLRWDHPVTLQAWESAKMDYDSTLGYADRIGFRCGTCFDYPAINPQTYEILNLRIRPLIAMDVTFSGKMYMNLGYSDKALEKLLLLKGRCRKVKGNFNLLWHNNNLQLEGQRKLYQKVVSYEL